MTVEQPLCPVCGRRTLDVITGEQVCPVCLGRLRGLLRGVGSTTEREAGMVVVPSPRHDNRPIVRRAVDGRIVVAGLADSLEAAIRHELRFASPGPSSRSSDARLPLVPAAVFVRDELQRVLDEQARDIAAIRGLRPPARALVPLSAFLITHVSWLRTRDDGPDRVLSLTDAIVSARRAIEHPPDLVYRGRCTAPSPVGEGLCDRPLYGPAGRVVIECRWCGAEYQAEQLRAALLFESRRKLMTATQAALALHALGVESATPSMVRGWVHRDQVKPRDWLGPGRARPVYRFADVWDNAVRLGLAEPATRRSDRPVRGA